MIVHKIFEWCSGHIFDHLMQDLHTATGLLIEQA
jgi:hypothetical protein